jgi:hypothetical protein
MSKKITQLPPSGALAATSLFETARDPSGAPVSEKASLTQLLTFIGAQNPLNLAGISITTAFAFNSDGSSSFSSGALTVDTGGNVNLGLGNILLNVNGSAQFSNGAATINFDGSAAFTGQVLSTSFTGIGTALTALTATNISGVIPAANLPILRAYQAANATNATTTFANTSLSVNVIAGHKYSFVAELFLSDSTAADGAKIDFNGGTAAATDFRAQVTAFDTALNLSTQVTTLAGTASASTFTGAGAFEIHGSFEPTGSGTFILRFAQNAHTVGTLTLARGSHITLVDTSV